MATKAGRAVFIAGGGLLLSGAMEIEDADRLVAPPRSLWPLLAIAGVLVLGTLVVLLAWPSEPDRAQVLVVVRGCSERCADAIVERLDRTLASGGFELVRPPTTPSGADQAREMAAREGAQHALFVELNVHEEREAGSIDPAYASATASATLSSITGEPAVVMSTPRVAAHGRDLARALEDVGARAAAPIADAVHLALLERESVRAFAEEVASSPQIGTRQNAIRELLPRVARVHEEREWIRESCESAAGAVGEGGGHCVSDACAEEYAFDVTPDGAAALVHVETPGVRIPLRGPRTSAERVETEERIELVPLGGTGGRGSERRVLGRADNYYTYPAYAAGRVIAIEEWPGGFGMVSIDVESGARTALARFDGRYVQSPELSPDGARVLYRLRASRRAPAQLVVSPAIEGAPMTLLGDAHLGAWVTLAPREGELERTVVAELVALERVAPPEQPEETDPEEDAELPSIVLDSEPPADGLYPIHGWTDRLALIDPDDGSPIAWLDDELHEVDRVAGVLEGRVAFTWRNGRVCGVGLWDPRRGEVSYVRTTVCVRDARVAGSGLVATAHTRTDAHAADAEVVLVDPSDGSIRALTANGLRERYPRAAGGRIVFDRVGESRYRSFPRVATCWLETD